MYRISVSRPCQHSRLQIRQFYSTSVSFTPHPSDFDGLKTAPSAPSGINVARNVARDVARNVSRNVSRDVARDVGRMQQYDHLAGAGLPPLFYISHNLSVEMGDLRISCSL